MRVDTSGIRMVVYHTQILGARQIRNWDDNKLILRENDCSFVAFHPILKIVGPEESYIFAPKDLHIRFLLQWIFRVATMTNATALIRSVWIGYGGVVGGSEGTDSTQQDEISTLLERTVPRGLDDRVMPARGWWTIEHCRASESAARSARTGMKTYPWIVSSQPTRATGNGSTSAIRTRFLPFRH